MTQYGNHMRTEHSDADFDAETKYSNEYEDTKLQVKNHTVVNHQLTIIIQKSG